jgi:hypothetical protein
MVSRALPVVYASDVEREAPRSWPASVKVGRIRNPLRPVENAPPAARSVGRRAPTAVTRLEIGDRHVVDDAWADTGIRSRACPALTASASWRVWSWQMTIDGRRRRGPDLEPEAGPCPLGSNRGAAGAPFWVLRFRSGRRLRLSPDRVPCPGDRSRLCPCSWQGRCGLHRSTPSGWRAGPIRRDAEWRPAGRSCRHRCART